MAPRGVSLPLAAMSITAKSFGHAGLGRLLMIEWEQVSPSIGIDPVLSMEGQELLAPLPSGEINAASGR